MLVLIIPLFLVLLIYINGKKNLAIYKKQGIVFCCTVFVLLWMSSVLFPYDFISDKLGNHVQLINILQYSIRWIYWTPCILIALGCICIVIVRQYTEVSSQVVRCSIIVFVSLFIISANNTLSYAVNTGNSVNYYDTVSLNSFNTFGNQYLSQDADTTLYIANRVINSENVEIIEYNKNKLNVELSCANTSELNGYIELPITYYRGYYAFGDNKENFQIVQGDNAVLRIMIPANYQGNIKIRFRGFWYWNISNMISLLSLMILLFIIYIEYIKKSPLTSYFRISTKKREN